MTNILFLRFNIFFHNCFWKKKKSEHFNISENNIINVKATKLVGYLPMLGSSFIFQRTIDSKYLKKSESKNQPFPSISKSSKNHWFSWKNQWNSFQVLLNFSNLASLEPMWVLQIILLSSQFWGQMFHNLTSIKQYAYIIESKNWHRTGTRSKNHPTPSLHVFYQDACKVTSWPTSQLYKSSIDQMQWAISQIVNQIYGSMCSFWVL